MRGGHLTPEGMKRAGKAQGSVTPVACAFPQFAGDIGHLHIGLPVRPIGLPFRMQRSSIRRLPGETSPTPNWNLALVPILSHLWQDAVLDLFQRMPSRGWAAVPLTSRILARRPHNGAAAGRTRDVPADHRQAEFADALLLDGGEGLLPLSDLAYEAPELSDLLSAADVCVISGRKGAVARSARSTDDRWRHVLDELRDAWRRRPRSWSMWRVRCSSLTTWTGQRSSWLLSSRLRSRVIWLARSASIRVSSVEDGSRVIPGRRGDLDVLLPADSGPLWEKLGMGSRLHPAFGASGGGGLCATGFTVRDCFGLMHRMRLLLRCCPWPVSPVSASPIR